MYRERYFILLTSLRQQKRKHGCRNNPLRDIGAFLTPDGGASKSFRYHPRVNTTPTQTLFHPHSQGVVLNLCANTVARLQYGARPNVYTPPPRLPPSTPPPPRRHMASALTATTDRRPIAIGAGCVPSTSHYYCF